MTDKPQSQAGRFEDWTAAVEEQEAAWRACPGRPGIEHSPRCQRALRACQAAALSMFQEA